MNSGTFGKMVGRLKKRRWFRLTLFVAAGAAFGLTYYSFAACTTGACILTSHWYVTTAYGAFMGLVASRI